MGKTAPSAEKPKAATKYNRGRPARGALLVEKPSTKALLMDVGEELFGLYGLDGISLREIAASAGQANTNVVQYYFNDKLGFIQAIVEDRILRREKLRREALDRLVSDRTQINPRNLLAAILLPALAFQNPRSGHVFCRFLLQCYLHPNSGFDDIDDRYAALRRQEKNKKKEDRLALIDSVELLQQCLKDLPPAVLFGRLKVIHLMFLSCVVEFDNARASGKRGPDFDAEPILNMAFSALTAPLEIGEQSLCADSTSTKERPKRTGDKKKGSSPRRNGAQAARRSPG